MKKNCLILLVLVLFITNALFATDSIKKDAVIVKLDLKQEVNPSARRNTSKAFEMAKKYNAAAIIIDMNTPGGLLNEADSIRTKIINSTIPVYVLINPNAASAGALISIACNKIYMSNGSTIGAATVVTQNAEALPDKYQSYMRAMMRSTAEFRGRNPDIAEAMVDENLEVEGISPEGQVLTLTRSEAMEVGFCDGEAETIDEVLVAEGYQNYQVKELQFSAIDKIINFLINPAIHGLLILIIIGGIYYELQSPGIGFPLAAAAIAAILYFAPLYLENLAASWEILLFIAGIILIGLEIFVIPGFGVAGVVGIIFVLSSLVLSMIGNVYFDFTFSGGRDIVKALLTVTISFILALVLIFATGGKVIGSRLFQRLVLKETLTKGDYRTTDHKDATADSLNLTGQNAITFTEMHPSGKISLNNNIYDAISEGQYIAKGTRVVIIEDLGNKLIVREDNSNDIA
ncbi:MAG: nodulation protein NfeD [Bacteroidetes bacterium]|nr:nodulation protein NfeD [Bacteroidota bacterium]MBL6962967.1 nodulation protein NfeD [Bacteroidota bacterium]